MFLARKTITFFCVMLLFAAVTATALSMSRKPTEPDHVPGKVLVRFKEGVSPERAAVIIASVGGTIESVMASTGVHLVLLPEGMAVEEAIGKLTACPEVLYAEPVHRTKPLEEDE